MLYKIVKISLFEDSPGFVVEDFTIIMVMIWVFNCPRSMASLFRHFGGVLSLVFNAVACVRRKNLGFPTENEWLNGRVLSRNGRP